MHLVTLCRGRRPRRPAQAWHRSPWRASDGSLSFCGERKGGKNAAKTNGFGFLARAWCGMYRDLSAPRIKRYKPDLCFRIAFCAYPPRRAPRLCCLSKQGSPLHLPAGGAEPRPYEALSLKQCVGATLSVARELVTEHRSSPPYSRITAPLFFSARPDWMSARVSSKSSLVCWPVFMSLQATTPAAISSPPRKIT